MNSQPNPLRQPLETLLEQYGPDILGNPTYCRNFLRDTLGHNFSHEAACLAAIAYTGYPRELWQSAMVGQNIMGMGSLALQTAEFNTRFSPDMRQQALLFWQEAIAAKHPQPQEVVTVTPVEVTVVPQANTQELIHNYASTQQTPPPKTGGLQKPVIGVLVAMGLLGVIWIFSKNQTPSHAQQNPQEAELRAKAQQSEQELLKLKIQLEQEKQKSVAQQQVPNQVKSTPIRIPVSSLTASASSSIRKTPGRAGYDFTPEMVLDNDYTTNWQEDTDGPGIGEWIQLSISPAYDIQSLEIRNGYADTNDVDYGNLFEKNNRAKDARLEYSNGIHYNVLLKDTAALQTLQAPSKGEISWVKLQIQSVYKGRKFDDTCISDINLYGTQHSSSSTSEQSIARPDYYTVQVASRKSYQDALSFSQLIPNSSVFKKPPNNGVTWYAVTVGQFSSKDEASQFKPQVISQFSQVGTADDIPQAFVTHTSKFEK